MECVVNPGNEISLIASVIAEDVSQFTYEWYFIDSAGHNMESKIKSCLTNFCIFFI